MTRNRDRVVRGYSKGMRQRTKLAQALVHDPEVLFLDEPLTGTDPVARRDLMDIIQRLGGQGKSVLVSSHVLHEVESLTPNIILLNRGRLVAEGHVREIRDLIDKYPHHIVLVCDEYRKLAEPPAGVGGCRGGQDARKGARRHGRNARAGRVLWPAAAAIVGGGDGHPRGVFRRRQSGSGLQISGEQMKTSSSSDVIDVTAKGHAAKVAGAAPRRSSGLNLTALGALYVLTLRQHLHGKRMLALGAVLLLPAVIAAIVRATAPDLPGVMLEFMFVFMLIPQALLPLVALLYGSGIIQDEQEEQTFTYILVRPIPKWAIYVTKVAGTLTTAILLTAIFTALTYVVIYTGSALPGDVDDIPLRCLKAIGIHALAIAAYCCIFGLLSLLTRWTLVVGFLYAAFFEGFLANLPFSIRLVSVIYYARLIAYRSLDFFVTPPRGPKFDMAAEGWQLHVRADPTLSEHPTLAACITVLIAGSVVCTALGAFLCSRREFHVKTPEGG